MHDAPGRSTLVGMDKPIQHPDEPAYSEREMALAEDSDKDGELTDAPGTERAIVRRDLGTETTR